ncbi:MAG: glycosyltransferase, partial [Actinomycetota bacterium]
MRIVRYYPRALIGDGGMTGAVRRWSQGLAETGAEVVIAFDRGDLSVDGAGVEWIKVRHVGRKGFRIPVGLEEILAEADLIVLHSGWVSHGIRAASVARRLGIPYLLEPRGAYDPHILSRRPRLKRTWWSVWEESLVMNARAVHVFFDEEEPHVRGLGYPGPLVVAPNGAEPGGEQWDGGSGGFLLWLGRFDPEHKGIDLLLDGLALLPRPRRPKVRLHGPDWRGRKQLVEAMVAERGLSGWVSVEEAVYGDDKLSLLRTASGFVYPSRWDACPNAVLEAVGMGVPTMTGPYPLGA